jgi:hypothetical protein
METITFILAALTAGAVVGLGPILTDFFKAITRAFERSHNAQLALEEVSTQADELASATHIESEQYPSGEHQESPSEPLTLAQQDLRAAVAILQSAVRDSKRQIDYNAEEQKSAARQQLAYFILSIVGAIAGIVVVIYGVYLTLNGQADVGTITAIAGAVPGAMSAMLFKRADAAEKRRDLSSARTAESVERAQSMLRIIQMTSRLDDIARQRILALAALADMFPGSKPSELIILLGDK